MIIIEWMYVYVYVYVIYYNIEYHINIMNGGEAERWCGGG